MDDYFQQLNEFKKDIFSDRRHAKIFQAKVDEFAVLAWEESLEKSKRLKEAATEPNEEKRQWLEWAAQRAGERCEENRKEKKRFEWYASMCEGKTDQEWHNKVEQAKAIPIAQIVGFIDRGRHRQMELCPIRQEKTPSFCWYKNNNSWYCFSCHEGGDAINLYMLINNVEFKEAVPALIQ